MEIHCQLAEVYRGFVLSWLKVLVWYNAFNNGKADVDEKL
jgi:hypothetical protein